MSDQRIPISQLSETQTAPDASYIAIDDGSLTKKITVENFNSTSTASAQQYANQAAASAQTVEDNIATSAAQIREATLAAREATQASTAATASATSAYDSASLAQNYSVNAATSAGQAMNAADTVAQGVTESKEYAEDSEAWAVGKRNGSDVPSSDVAYHNNAKYYSDNATTAATRAEAAAQSINVPDTTLTVSGVAADSKVVGDRISAASTEFDNVANRIKNIVALDATFPTVEILTNKVLSFAGIISNASGDLYTVTDYIPVQAGQCVAFKYSRARWANQNWAFYDGDKNCIGTYGKTSSATTVEIGTKLIVPYGAEYMVISRDMNGVSGNEADLDFCIITKYSESVDSLPETVEKDITQADMTEADVTTTETASRIIGSYGFIVPTTSAAYIVTECDVNADDVINIRNAKAFYSNKIYAFYDASELPIQTKSRSGNDPTDFLMLSVPFGAVKLAVSGNGTPATVKKVTKYAPNKSVMNWTGKKWACVGDSLTDAGNSRATKRYFDYIAENTGIVVTNLGKSGTGYMKPYNSNLPFYQRVDTIPLDSDVITIFGSGNDCSLTLGSPTDTGTDTVCGCINNTIDGIRNRIIGANLGIITPTPWDDYPTTTSGNRMDLYADALVEICHLKGVPCLDLYHCSNMLPWEQTFREAYYTRDDGNGVHPDENGHKLFAPRIQAFLSTLLM